MNVWPNSILPTLPTSWKNLAPDEREAVFETLDEGVAAGALEELEPKVQKAVLESLDSERAADIVEEMQPDAAADLLADLSDERTEEILVQMQPEERQEVTDLLEFKENTAAGRMTTEYIALPVRPQPRRCHRGHAVASKAAWKT